VFEDLDASLVAVLGATGAPAEVSAADVSFAVPDKDFAPGQATLDLFLHEVQENRALRDETQYLRRLDAGGWQGSRGPLRVDCTYLVTAWSQKSGGLKTAEEHRLLGLALLWLAGFPTIPEPFLQGALRNPLQPFPLATNVAQTREGQSMGEFWTALGISPRPAFSLTITLALQPFPALETYPDVSELHLRTGLSSDPVLQGRVLDPALAAVPGATVRLVEAARTATADADGGYHFADVPFGGYTLTVQSAGHPDTSRHVDYEREAQVHDVILTGP
jgi:hypothetical protein